MNHISPTIDTTPLKEKGLQPIQGFFSDAVKADLAARASEIIARRDAGELSTETQDSKGLPYEWGLPILHHPALTELMTQLLGPNVAATGWRVLAKDKHFTGSVHIHQDWPYNAGDTRKLSVFVPLTRVNRDNGGIVFLEESHHYGPVSMGPLDPSLFPPMAEVCPDIEVGDILVCNFLTWHYSNPSANGEERIMLQLNYQPADDASSNNLAAGARSHDKVLLSRFDASSAPSVELNGEAARAQLRAGDPARAERFARGLLFDDPQHAGAALLLYEILSARKDPNALSYLEKARTIVDQQQVQVSRYYEQFGGARPASTAAPAEGSAADPEAVSPWTPALIAFERCDPPTRIISTLPATLDTPNTAWSYGWISTPIQTAKPSTLRIHATALRGKIGFSLIDLEFNLVSEQLMISPGADDAPVLLAINGDTAVRLVVRNFDDDGQAGEVSIEGADLFAYS